MPKKSFQNNNLRDVILYKFFEEFGIKPTNKTIKFFRQYIDHISKTTTGKKKVDQFQQILEDWLQEKYQPDMFATGGTINTLLSKEGSRLPDKETQEKLLQKSATSTRKKVIVYEYALDSSNQTLQTQEQLMGKLGEVAFKDIKEIENLTIHLKKPGKYINIDQIAYYFNFPKPLGPGTVITHGTDTLEENAALSAYMMLPKTLVWTGSWASPGEEDSDAFSNIEKAKLLANNSLTPIGVYVVIGDEIHLATRLKKINTHPWKAEQFTPYSSIKPWRREGNSLSYFSSIGDDPVGYFNKDGEIFFSAEFLRMWEEILIKRFDSYFPLKKVSHLKPAYVEHTIINEHTPREVFKNLIKRLSAKTTRCGAVIEGDITKNPHFEEFISIMRRLNEEKDIFILSTAKTSLSMAYKNLNMIPPVQLRIKLSALMGRDDVNSANLILLIDDNLAGEVLEKKIVEENKLDIPRSFYEKGEFIIAFPGMTREIIDDAIENLMKKRVPKGEKPVLLINGYGDGHIPIGCMSMEERLLTGFDPVDPQLAELLINDVRKSSIEQNEEPEFSVETILKHLTKLKNGDSIEAKKLLRKAFINSNDLLGAIGGALDKDIRVLMGSKVEYAVPNLEAYEIGTILKHIGVINLSTTTYLYLNR